MRSNKVYRRLSLREERKDQKDRFLEKDRSDVTEVFEDVFDRLTLMTIYELMNRGVMDHLEGVVNEGKESKIYLAKGRSGEELAVKIYLVVNVEFRRKRVEYVTGDPRFEKVPHNLRRFVYLWALREYENLKAAYYSNVRVPEPIAVKRNVLVMRFLGVDGRRYPLLREYVPEAADEYSSIYDLVIANLKKLYTGASMVHGDLSEYNVLVASPTEIYFIDLSQAIGVTHHRAGELLYRDLVHVNNFFRRRGVDVIDEVQIYKELTGRDPPIGSSYIRSE
ncbi:MAG: serine protein kinase RIO [Aigarchaeota archaeon]|nr:serine protein kinase RIO [Aigarchaeota archaeon]MDW8092371.1 serine protein kinase RIO [Nitrososphaerota archaeon]